VPKSETHTFARLLAQLTRSWRVATPGERIFIVVAYSILIS